MKTHIAAAQVFVALRLSLGFIFLWAFLDKLFGLGFSTPAESSWIAGGSPTTGFLMYGTKGPFAELFQSLAGSTSVDVLFMLGLAFVGATLISGIMVKLGSYTGMLLMTLMYLAASIFPEHNPLIDDHVIYFFVLWYFALQVQVYHFGASRWWGNRTITQKYPILK